MTLIRQGDVLIRKIDSLPADLTEVPRDELGRIVLAFGEVTGHAHAIAAPQATLLTDDENRRFLSIMDTVTLDHEEHSTLVFEPGNYEVIQQRQMLEGAIVRVVD